METDQKINSYSVTVVVPAYNEEAEIAKTVNEIYEFLVARFTRADILVLDDGSTDATYSILKSLQERISILKVIRHGKNQGIGPTMLDLYKNASGDYAFFLPGDRQVRIEALNDFIPHIGEFDIISGWRVKREDPFPRILNQKLYHLGLRLCFGIKLRDVDCIKLYPTRLFREITLSSDSAFQEAEIIYKAAALGFKIGEVPVRHYPRKGGVQTGAHPGVILKAVKDFVIFFFDAKRRKD